jgi:hypothetical protein
MRTIVATVVATVVATAVISTTSVADARGIYFHLFATDKTPEVVAEARSARCDHTITDPLEKIGHVTNCHAVGGGSLLGIALANHTSQIVFVTAANTVAWQRTIPGDIDFADDAILVVSSPATTTLHALWLDPKDGRTVTDVTFAPTAKLATLPATPWCGDEIKATYRSTERASRLAAVCLVLD